MINWKLRLQNKTTLVTMILAIISFVYMVLDACGVVPKIEQDIIVKIAIGLIDLLAILGIVVDPTTAGVSDSQRAMTYVAPGVPAETVESVEVVADGPGSEE